MGIDPHPITHNNPLPDLVQESDGTFFEPPPTQTQCADFDAMVGRDYVAVIVGNVKNTHYAVTVEINENNSAYTKPGTVLYPGDINSGSSAKVYEMSGKNRRWQQVYGPAQQDTVIVLYPGRISGTVDAWMATTDQSQKTANSTLHMQENGVVGEYEVVTDLEAYARLLREMNREQKARPLEARARAIREGEREQL